MINLHAYVVERIEGDGAQSKSSLLGCCCSISKQTLDLKAGSSIFQGVCSEIGRVHGILLLKKMLSTSPLSGLDFRMHRYASFLAVINLPEV